MKYLWIVMLVFFGGLWSIAAIYDIIDSIRYKHEPETLTAGWILAIIGGLFIWSFVTWMAS